MVVGEVMVQDWFKSLEINWRKAGQGWTRLPQEPDRPWMINHLATMNFR